MPYSRTNTLSNDTEAAREVADMDVDAAIAAAADDDDDALSLPTGIASVGSSIRLALSFASIECCGCGCGLFRFRDGDSSVLSPTSFEEDVDDNIPTEDEWCGTRADRSLWLFACCCRCISNRGLVRLFCDGEVTDGTEGVMEDIVDGGGGDCGDEAIAVECVELAVFRSIGTKTPPNGFVCARVFLCVSLCVFFCVACVCVRARMHSPKNNKPWADQGNSQHDLFCCDVWGTQLFFLSISANLTPDMSLGTIAAFFPFPQRTKIICFPSLQGLSTEQGCRNHSRMVSNNGYPKDCSATRFFNRGIHWKDRNRGFSTGRRTA